MKVITTAVIKGGAGKTTTAASLAQYAIKQGYRVLCIDLDPQANLSLLLDADPQKPGAFELITGSTAPAEAIQQTSQGIYCACASRNLSAMNTAKGSATRLKEALRALNNSFDFCFIDTPPSLSELVYNALIAADLLLIPLEAAVFSLQGFYQMVELVGILEKNGKPVKEKSVIVTRYDSRPKVIKQLRQTIEEKCAEFGFAYLGEIRKAAVIDKVMFSRENLYDYDPKSKPAIDYAELFKKLK